MNIAEFEVMRAANDRRNTVWAAALSTHVRQPERDNRAEVKTAILRLTAEGDLFLSRTSWSGDQPVAIPRELAEAALMEESQWHPRRLPWARRLRLVATAQGSEKFWGGEFGTPAPICRSLPAALDLLELQPITCAEATGMVVGVVGFILGSTFGYVVVTRSLPLTAADWSITSVLAWVTGGLIGLTSSLWAWNSRFPSPDGDTIPPAVVPDQFNQGPDLNGRDVFGDPRF